MSQFYTALSWGGKKSSRGSNEDEHKDLREQADKRMDFSEEPRRKKVADGSPLSGSAPAKPTGLKLMLKRQESEKHNLLRFGLLNLYVRETGQFTFHAAVPPKKLPWLNYLL